MKNAEGILLDPGVSVYHDPQLTYPDGPPYSSHVRHPEYLFQDISKQENWIYDAVRSALFLLGEDKGNFNTPYWNPLGEIVRPGDAVVIKPNFVLSSHDEGGDLFSIITHPSVIRAVVDYVYIALKGKGRIIIADAPQMDCNFRELLDKTGLETIRELYQKELGFSVEIYDLRDFWLDKTDASGVAYAKNRHKLSGDPSGNVPVNLGRRSAFYGVGNYAKFYGADYDRKATVKHHHGDVHEYLLSRTVLSADVVILVPKLKVHKKVGVTLNMKGLVGACVDKNYLVHYTLGTPSSGGDQFPGHVLSARETAVVKMQRWAYDMFLARRSPAGDFLYDAAVKLGKLILRPLGLRPLDAGKAILDAGNWYGNDSAWRMAVDLTRIFIYADKEGNLKDMPVRRMFSIVDGVVGGERNGPLAPDSKQCGLIVAGFNPCAVDLACARLMGYDYQRIRMLKYVSEHPELFKVSPSQIRTFSNIKLDNLFARENRERYLNFVPHPGWQGHIELP